MNLQPVEKQELSEDGTIEYFKIWRTIQGEGPFVGMPATFVRLAGCNLRCPLCDTDYTSQRTRVTEKALAKAIQDMTPVGGLVVFTGGEPFRQRLGEVISLLLWADCWVQIETNGTLYQDVQFLFPLALHRDKLVVVCSPKTPNISPAMEDLVHSWKYVVEAGRVSEADGLPLSALGMPAPPFRPRVRDKSRIYVQPLDEGDVEKNKVHLAAALHSCQTFGYRLCLQIHKQLGLE